MPKLLLMIKNGGVRGVYVSESEGKPELFGRYSLLGWPLHTVNTKVDALFFNPSPFM